MSILEETAQLVQERLGKSLETLTIENIVIGLFFTGVRLSNGTGGICFTPVKDIPQAVCCPSSARRILDPFKVRGIEVKEVLSEVLSREPIKVAVAIATLNALSATCLSQGWAEQYRIKIKTDALDVVSMPKETSVAVVGAIVPALQRLKKRGGTWWVIEQDPRTLKSDEISHFIPANRSVAIMRQSEVLIITGVTLLNHTLEEILQVARPSAEIAVIGPTASMLPEPLFARGVTAVGGVLVRHADKLLDTLAAGGSGYHFLDTLADRIVIERI